MKVKAKDLKLADVIKTYDGPFGTAIVKQIGEDGIHIFRPYGTTTDFSYTGGVICYVGIEEYKIYANDVEYEVFDRKNLR